MNHPNSIRVAIVDDEDGTRESIDLYLRTIEGLDCVSTFASADQALAGIPPDPPDVVLMDINMPGEDGISCTRRLKAACPHVQILMLTVYDDTDKLFRALAAGASGYLLKRVDPAQLVEAIRDVHAGGSPMSGSIARKVVQSFQQVPSTTDETDALSAREDQVLRFLARGYTYKRIAHELSISIDTTRTYIRRIYEKLHVHSRTEAVVRYLEASGGDESRSEETRP